MKEVITIARKEFVDLLRDRRAMITMIIIPLLLFPIIMSITGKVTGDQITKEQEKIIKIGIVNSDQAEGLVTRFKNSDGFEVSEYETADGFDTLIKTEVLDAGLFIHNGFEESIDSLLAGTLAVYYKSENFGVRNRVHDIINGFKSNEVEQRLNSKNLSKDILEPVHVEVNDITTEREKIGKAIGGILPYIFIIFSFMGCMYPAIDLFTNEKERGTLETILVAPVSRLSLLFGKMSIVAFTGLISASLSMIGLAVGFSQFSQSMPEDIFGALSGFIEPLNIILLLVMIIPLLIFFAGILTLITTYAKSYKEAQTIISPMMIVIIVPAVVGMLPGIELNIGTALIPISNISLASKEIIAGTIDYGLFALVILSLVVYAFISVFIAVKWFSRESNILRT